MPSRTRVSSQFSAEFSSVFWLPIPKMPPPPPQAENRAVREGPLTTPLPGNEVDRILEDRAVVRRTELPIDLDIIGENLIFDCRCTVVKIGE